MTADEFVDFSLHAHRQRIRRNYVCAAVGIILLALGARRPEESLGVQRAIAEMGFTVRRLVPNFNEYLGAGVLAGTSHLYQLATTNELRPVVVGRYDGPLYTGDVRDPGRRFKCFRCGTVHCVGRGEAWPMSPRGASVAG